MSRDTAHAHWLQTHFQWYPMGDVRTHNSRTDNRRIFKLGGPWRGLPRDPPCMTTDHCDQGQKITRSRNVSAAITYLRIFILRYTNVLIIIIISVLHRCREVNTLSWLHVIFRSPSFSIRHVRFDSCINTSCYISRYAVFRKFSSSWSDLHGHSRS